MFIRILAVVGLLIAISPQVQALAPVPKQPKMDAKTIAAFEKIGGVYGVIATGSNGYMQFDSSTEGIAKGGLPSFRVPYVTIGAAPLRLPPVEIPFGLVWLDSHSTGFTKEMAEMPHLTTIIFAPYATVDDQLNNLAHAKGLTGLRFSFGGTNDKALKIVGQLKTLNRLEIDWSSDVTASGWQHLTELKELTSFKTQVSHLSDTEMKMIGSWSKLRSLGIQHGSITDKGVLELASLKDLEWLVLEGTNLTDASLKILRNFKRLVTLHIRTKFTIAGIRVLNELTDLEELGLNHTGVDDTDIRELAGLTKLSTLHLGWTRVTGKELHPFAALKTLDIRHSPVTDEGLKSIGQLKLLSSLQFAHNHISDADMKSLSGLKELKELSLAGTRVTEVGLREIKDFAQLERLDLKYTSASDANMPMIASFRSLKYLDLSFTTVGDRGIKELKALPKLDTLSLRDTPVTDVGFGELEHFPSLRWVDITNSKVTQEGFDRMRKALPGCRIGAGPFPR